MPNPFHSISDNFARADGALGANWAAVIANNAESGPNTFQGNVLINGQGYGPINAFGGDACALWQGSGGPFGNDQWAVAQVKAAAAPTAVLAITAALQVGGNTTYTYTVSSGSVATAIASGTLYVVIAGMAHAGNNGFFVSTTFGAGTFTVANASGVTATESGTGTCPSDSGAGVMVRGSGTSAATLNGYFFHAGSNSFSGDGRVCYHELWKVVNGTGTIIAGPLNKTTLLPVGEFIAITAIGSTIRAYINGVLVATVIDAAVASGVPGVTSWSMNGLNEYIWANWPTSSTATGNNGTTLNAFQAGDTTDIINQLASENFKETGSFSMVDLVPYANGDLHTANANWVYQGASTFNVNANRIFGLHAGLNFAYRSDITPTNDQFSEVKCVIAGGSGTQNGGPACRVDTTNATGYIVQIANNVLQLSKEISGTLTTLSSNVGSAVTGDTVRLTVSGTTLNVYKNGVRVIGPVTDSSIASGQVGIFDTGTTNTNGFSAWTGGSLTALTSATNFISGTGQAALLDPTNGVYPGSPDSSNRTQILENTISWPANQYAEAVITSTAAPIGGTDGPAVRQSVGMNGYYFGPDNAGNVKLFRVDSGVFTQLGSVGHTYASGETYRIEAQGPYIVGKINGVVVIPVVDTTYTSGKPGIIWSAGGSRADREVHLHKLGRRRTGWICYFRKRGGCWRHRGLRRNSIRLGDR